MAAQGGSLNQSMVPLKVSINAPAPDRVEGHAMKALTLTVTSLAIFAGVFLMGKEMDSVQGLLFFAPFVFGPLFITLILAVWCRGKLAECLLLVSTLLYFPWFLFIYMSVMHWHPDAQGGIAFLFVGIYSLPIMIPFWTLAWLKRKPLA
jgi:hypothetical protein